MTEAAPTVEELVSDAYFDAIIYQEPTAPYKQWLSWCGEAGNELPPIWDEEAIMDEVRSMLHRAVSIFSTLPSSVERLRRLHLRALDEGDQYMRYALSAQVQRLERGLCLLGSRRDNEKLADRIERGIDRKADMFELIQSEEYLTKAFLARVKRGIDPSHVHAELTSETESKIDKLMQEMEKACNAIDMLEVRIAIIDKINTLLESTRSRLNDLGGPIDINGSRKSPPSFLSLEEVGQESGLPLNEGKKRKSRPGGNTEECTADVPSTGTDEAYSKEKLSIDKLRNAIELAKTYGKIRVVVPHEGNARPNFETKWRKLFSKLGYNGKLEFVKFTDLNKTNDYDAPVVLPHSMNIHSNLWNRSRFTNCFVLDVKSQNALMSYLDQRKG